MCLPINDAFVFHNKDRGVQSVSNILHGIKYMCWPKKDAFVFHRMKRAFLLVNSLLYRIECACTKGTFSYFTVWTEHSG